MSELLERLNEALQGSYRLTGELGAGGMATVFAAQDLRHDRRVAVKVLRSELAAAVGADRFLAEIRTTARLQHPNILPLFDSGDAAGQLYFVMPYVEGPSLYARLQERGPLPVDEAVELTCTISGALQHAHRHGVIHRDIKPENILLYDGVPVLVDFGLALAVQRAESRLTQVGMALGTVAFMSPEQAMGKTDLDARTDIYSLACVLYEALCGEPPHSAENVQAILARRLVEPPTPIRSLRADVPQHVEAALGRALAVDPGDRFANVEQFAAALRQEEATADQELVYVLRAEPRSYGVLMHEGDEQALRQARHRALELVASVIESGGGLLHPSPGDALVATFIDAQAGLACARAGQEAIAQFNAERPASEHIHYRFGIAGGEPQEAGVGIAGEALERASELAWVAPSDGINLTLPLREALGAPEQWPGSAPGGQTVVPPQLESIDLPAPTRPSIAIMPFTSPDGDPDSQAIAEGLRIDITNALMKIDRIFLTAPSVMNHFRGADGEQTAKQMGTRHLLEGTVRRSGERVRVGMQLTDTSAGRLVWTERYDRILDGAFELQDEIAARVITELDVKLTMGEQARVWRKCLTHPEARRHYYRGLNHFFQSTRDSVAAARTEFERVARLVPDSPVGATWTALSLWLQATRSWDPQASALAIEWARQATALPDADGQAHTVLGATLLLERRWEEAIRTARDSIQIRPGCNTANGVLANVLLHCGEYQDAIVHAKRAIRIGPVYPPLFLETLGAAYREDGQLGLAITVCREISRLAPESVSGRLVLASALVRGGWLAEARHALRDLPKLEPDFNLERYLANQPYRSNAVIDRLRSDLRQAGLR